MSGRGRAHVPDPDRVEDILDVLMVCRGFDGTILSDLTGDQVLENARRTRMILSRHGRVDYFAWEERDVGEMRLALEDLLFVIKQESDAAKAAASSRGG